MKLFDFFNKRKKLTLSICIGLASALLITSGVFFYIFETSEIIHENINIKKTKPSGTKAVASQQENNKDESQNYADSSYGNDSDLTINSSNETDMYYSDETEDTDTDTQTNQSEKTAKTTDNQDAGENNTSDNNTDNTDSQTEAPEDDDDSGYIDYIDEVEDHSVTKSFVPKGYKKVWGDDFNGKKLDTNKWNVVTNVLSDTIWVFESDVLSLKDGLLKLTTKHFFDPYDSLPEFKLPAEINTMNTMNFQYGYLEMCAKVPFKTGAWPSLWLKGINGPAAYDRQELVQTDYKNDAYSSEIDIFENFATGDTISSNLHKWYSGGGNSNTSTNATTLEIDPEYRFPYVSNLSNEFHVYGFEWTDKKISMYVDGEAYCTYDITEKGNFDDQDHITDMSGFHDPHYLLIWNNIYTPLTQTNNIVNPSELPFHYDIERINLYQKPGLGKIYTKGEKQNGN